MIELKSYLIRIVATAILCGIIKSLCETSKLSAMVRMSLSIVMAIAVLRPILNIDINDFSLEVQGIAGDAEAIISEGTETAQDALADLVSQQTANFLKSKALQLGADVEVQVHVRDGVPVGATMTGDILPYIKSQLSAWMAAEIGIEREAQNWN